MNPKGAAEKPQSYDWHQLASLGERLRQESSFPAQRDRIIEMMAALIEGKADAWLNEEVFRLPDWDEAQIPPQALSWGMKRAIKTGKIFLHKPADSHEARAKSAQNDKRTFAAAALSDQGFALGALQVTRPKGPAFTETELNLLQGLAEVVSMSLIAWHRAEVEKFRLRQLNLVRAVSAQIANVLNLDELANRVAGLIQKTFNFYYVAIFTLEPHEKKLRFRSSSLALRRGKRRPQAVEEKKISIPLEVKIGEGLIGEAASAGTRIICDDVRSDPRYRFIPNLPRTKSEVVIPLKIEERILGVLDVQSNKLGGFHPNDLLVLDALADNIAQAIEGANLYNELRRRADQLTLVSEVSKIVTATLELADLMNAAAALIHNKFEYPYVMLFTVHPNRRLIAYQAGSGVRSKSLDGYVLSLDDADGIIPWVARNGQTVLANDVTQHPRYVPSQLPPKDTQSELCVPLIFDGEVVGLLDIQSDQLNAFTDNDQLMFESVADAMAAAIRNADLYRSEIWRRQVADSLREVAGLISDNVGLDEVLQVILAELDRNLPIDISAIWLLEEGDLCLSAVHGVDASELESACMANPESIYAMSEALMSEEPIIRRPDETLWPIGLTVGYQKNYSSIAAPLRVGDRPLGLLTLSHHTPGRYGHEAQAITATLASYASVAIENARLYDAAQEQAYASAALLQVAQAVVSLNDLDEILGTIIRIMPILVGVQRVALYRWDALRETFGATHAYGFSEEEEIILTEVEHPVGHFPLLDITRGENRTVIHPVTPSLSPTAWLEIQPESADEAEAINAAQLLIAVPIVIKNDSFGVMVIQEKENGRRFRSRRIEIINGIAQQVALAIQNDLLQTEMVVRERLETEVQLARQIQQTFIPQTLPQHFPWQLAGRWRTARQVGGDFYDVIELPNRKLGIFIADVSDKGMPAALFMALTRTLIRAAVLETTSPAEAMRRVNDQLLPDTQQGMFVTAVYGVLDIEDGSFTYVNAGHNPPLWVKPNRYVIKLTRTAVALGVMQQPYVKENTISLEAGDALFLYTDGLTEAFSPMGDMFGDERLIAALQSAQASAADEILESVEACLNEFIESIPLGDDLTMLAARRDKNERPEG